MRFHFGLFCILFLIGVAATAQRKEPNALGSQPHPSDTSKIIVMLGQIVRLRDFDPTKASKLCHEVILLSKQLGYHKGIGRATGNLGWISLRSGDYVKALEYSIEALKISQKIGDSVEEVNSLNNMAGVEFEQKQFGLSLTHLTAALNRSMTIGDTKSTTRSLNNIAFFYLDARGNLDSAQAFASRALELGDRSGDRYNESYSNNTLGMIHVKRGNYGKALQHYFFSLEQSDGTSNSLMVETWNQIAEVYIKTNRPAQAVPILMKNITLTKKYHYRQSQARALQLLSMSYEAQGKSGVALEYLQRYVVLHDSIYNEQNSMKLATFQSQFDLDLKQAQIELLTKDTQLNKTEINRQRIQLYGSIGGLLAIMLIAGMLFYLNRRVAHANMMLEKQKQELAHKNEEVELKSRALEEQADELARLNATKDKLFSIIGHDFRSPLNSLKGILSLVENKNLSQEEFTTVTAKLKSNLDAVSTNLENLLQWSMAQLKGIQTNPINISVPSLVQENISLFKELAKAKNIQLVSEISESLFAFADENHTRLVLRNLINNAIKFTRPGGIVKISSQQESPFIKIMVADTGVGLESTQLIRFLRKEKLSSHEGTNHEKGVGLGLMLCQEFVENNGGQLSVASEPGKGSVFSFTLKAA